MCRAGKAFAFLTLDLFVYGFIVFTLVFELATALTTGWQELEPSIQLEKRNQYHLLLYVVILTRGTIAFCLPRSW